MLVGGRVEGCGLGQFEDATGLRLTDSNGIKDELPPINTFLNRLLALPIGLQNTLFSVFEELIATRVQGAIASGTYDVGLETLQADSLIVRDRQAIYTHPGSGAETRLLTIQRKRRNRPLALDAALAKQADPRVAQLVNSRSGRAALQLPDRGLLLDDGGVERRVRLLRPMEEHSIGFDKLAASHWEEADPSSFAAAWSAEIRALPEFTTDDIHIVTGLLLPIWRRFWSESSRVFRLQTDAGDRIIGRRVSPDWVAKTLGGQAPAIAPETAFAELLDGRIVLDLAEGLQLRRVRVMGDHRIELLNFDPGHRDRLKADGLFGEIAQWTFRMFVPTDASGAAVLAKVLARHPVAQRLPTA